MSVDDISNGLSIQWSFGFSKNYLNVVHSLSNSNRNALFFVSSHSGVIYDFEYRTQLILQGHCNVITSCCVSNDKRWIVTADSGKDPILVVWDSMTGAPVKSIFNPHESGTISCDMSSDSLYIVTLGNVNEDGIPQDIAVWAWTSDSDTAILRKHILSADIQYLVRFNPSNLCEIVTTGATAVNFWLWQDLSLEGYVAKCSKAEVGNYSGKLISTIFLDNTSNALTCTSDGYAIVWEIPDAKLKNKKNRGNAMRSAAKVLRLVEGQINLMVTTQNGYLAIGCMDGSVRFYDMYLRLEAWFDDLSAGPIMSLSFSNQSCPLAPGEGGAPGLKFWCPDFLVGTSEAFIVGMESSAFDEIKAENRRGTLLLQGMTESVSAIACHPSKSLIAIGGYNGTMQIWDYELKLLMNLREFNNTTATGSGDKGSVIAEKDLLRPNCLSYDSTGSFIAVGFTNGLLKFLDSETFKEIASYAPTYDVILGLKFSHSGKYLAAYDSSRHVLLFKSEQNGNSNNSSSSSSNSSSSNSSSSSSSSQYVYVGRILSHSATISSIEFGSRDGQELLLSVGEDRKVVEYDLESSSVTLGVITYGDRQTTKIETSAIPTSMLWYPNVTADESEDKFVIANNEFKFKEFNVDSKQCRRTTIAPTFGGPIRKLLPIKHDNRVRLYAYATSSKVIGIGCMPLTGSPSEIMGLVAHPGEISGIAISYDGKYMFSTGGSDLSTNMWAIDHTFASSCNDTGSNDANSSTDMSAFYRLLEGGIEGELYNDLVDYFYYCQLREDGENSMNARNLRGVISLEEIPSFMRAVGYYPCEDEVANMINEVRYSDFMTSGVEKDSINLNDLVRLYLNHRPLLPLASKSISDAFKSILKKASGGGTGSSHNRHHSDIHAHTSNSVSDSVVGDSISWSELKHLISIEGEVIPQDDLDGYLTALIGPNAKFAIDSDNVMFNSATFSDRILGFDDFTQ